MLINTESSRSFQVESIAEEGRVNWDGQPQQRTTAESDLAAEETELLSPEEVEEVK